jgi:hypothetical protein
MYTTKDNRSVSADKSQIDDATKAVLRDLASCVNTRPWSEIATASTSIAALGTWRPCFEDQSDLEDIARWCCDIVRRAPDDAAAPLLHLLFASHEALVQRMVRDLIAEPVPEHQALAKELTDVDAGCLGSACLRVREVTGTVDGATAEAIVAFYDALVDRHPNLRFPGPPCGHIASLRRCVEDARELDRFSRFFFEWENAPTWLVGAAAILNMATEDRAEHSRTLEADSQRAHAILIQAYHARWAADDRFNALCDIGCCGNFFYDHQADALHHLSSSMTSCTREGAQLLRDAIPALIHESRGYGSDCWPEYATNLLPVARVVDEWAARDLPLGQKELGIVDALLDACAKAIDQSRLSSGGDVPDNEDWAPLQQLIEARAKT